MMILEVGLTHDLRERFQGDASVAMLVIEPKDAIIQSQVGKWKCDQPANDFLTLIETLEYYSCDGDWSIS